MDYDILRIEIAKLDLKPGDVLLVHCPSYCNMHAREMIQEKFAAALPDHKCLVVPHGFTTEIVCANIQHLMENVAVEVEPTR